MDQGIGSEFLAQRAAINAEDTGSLALVAVGVVHNDFKKWSLNFAHNKIVQFTRTITVEAGEILVEGVFGVLVERLFALLGLQFVVFLILLLSHVRQIL